MENKHVGWLVIGIAAVMTIIVFIFNSGLKDIVGATCTHGASCSMFDTIRVQTWLSMSIIFILMILGIIIMFQKPKIEVKEKVIVKTKKIKEKKKKLDLKGLDEKEKQVIKILQDENGAIFQKTLMEKIEVGKVGMTRLLDKLEAKQFIERKRRGMNNIVVLKR